MEVEREESSVFRVNEPVDPGNLSVGLLKGRYRLIARLGEGGMGVTFRAWDTKKGIPVVIKMPREDARGDRLVIDRFAREVRTMLALSHPHIVPITDHGEDAACPFVVMRFLPGGSLTEYRAKEAAGEFNQLPPSSLHFWLPGISDALDFVHSHGVLHRDVKPGNIFLDGFLNPFLGDFGIAKVIDASAGLNRESTLTGTQMAIGTPEYMGPELFRAGAILDGRVDQYALGVIVYELLAGRKPFIGDSAHIIVEHFSKDAPPIREICPSVPKSTAEAVHRALAKNPEDRFGTCREFAETVLAHVPLLKIDLSRARLLCPQCKVILRVSVSSAGRMGTCPRCTSALFVAEDLGSLWLKGEDRSTVSRQAANPADFIADVSKPAAAADGSKGGWYSSIGSPQWRVAGVAAVFGILMGLILRGMSGSGTTPPGKRVDGTELAALRQQVMRQQASLDSVNAHVKEVEERIQDEKARNALLYRANHELVQQNRRLTASKAQEDSERSLGTDPPLMQSIPKDSELNQPEDLVTNGIGMELKLVPAGTFMMGDASGNSDESLHQVTLSQNFFVGIYEVTNAQWKRVMGSMPSRWEGESHPVEQVSWEEAVEFCERLSQMPEELASGRAYRLPTEAEWEYACRAGSLRKYSFGDNESELDSFGWFGQNSDQQSHPVGQKRPNAWGLYDMHGNVMEWCGDWYGTYSPSAQVDPEGPRHGVGRVFRGGCWHYPAVDCRAAHRANRMPSYRYGSVGFRVVMSLHEARQTVLKESRALPFEKNRTVIETKQSVQESSETSTRDSVDQGVVNSIGISMRLVPAGVFQMGSNDRADEQPVRRVRISKPFFIGVYEVTNMQWRTVMGSVRSKWQDDNRPVEEISWEEAVDFCGKLSQIPEERQAGRVYRLPTEAEWEYACRAKSTTRYSFADEEGELGKYAWFQNNSGGTTQPFGKKLPNAWGLYDMHGNVWEWCSDWYGPYTNQPVVDPQGSPHGSARVHRGGSWNYSAWDSRSAMRSSSAPTYRNVFIGLRVAMSPSGLSVKRRGSDRPQEIEPEK